MPLTNHRILCIEDEANIRDLLQLVLQGAGYSVLLADNGTDGLAQAQTEAPDLILLDLMLPGLSGLSVCRQLKESPDTRRIPLVMVTAKTQPADIVLGLESGADDYITKPFDPDVLVARLRVVLRRGQVPTVPEIEPASQSLIERGPIVIEPRKRRVTVDGTSVDLSTTEYEMLVFLSRRPGWVYTRNQMIDGVHGSDVIITDRAIDVTLVGLRKKLGDAREMIETVRGVGYRFAEPDREE